MISVRIYSRSGNSVAVLPCIEELLLAWKEYPKQLLLSDTVWMRTLVLASKRGSVQHLCVRAKLTLYHFLLLMGQGGNHDVIWQGYGIVTKDNNNNQQQQQRFI